MKFFETSAFSGVGINKAFQDICADILSDLAGPNGYMQDGKNPREQTNSILLNRKTQMEN